MSPLSFFNRASLLLKSFFNKIELLLAPPFCVSCHRFTHEHGLFLCSSCVDLIIPLATKQFFITQKYQATVFAVSDYQDPLRSLTLGKYYKNRLSSIFLAKLIWKHTDLRFQGFDIIVPLPLHWTRYAWRWYNQSEIMAETLSKLSGKPVVHLLTRHKRTLFQTGLSHAQRMDNVKGAFSLTHNAHDYKGKKIVLVDDVLTTGVTLSEAGKELVKMMPERVIFAVACRVGSR